MCEAKRRYLQKDEKRVQVGFLAFNKFYVLVQRSKEKTYAEFCKSSYYNAFVKFGRHMVAIRAINTAKFIDWVIKSNKKLDYWCKEQFYDEYLHEYIRIENPQDALERSIVEMETWATDNNSVVNHYFKYANENRMVRSIANGRISPWAVYCSDSGVGMLSRLNEEQIAIVYPWIDPDYWQRKLKNSDDAEWCRFILSEAGF